VRIVEVAVERFGMNLREPFVTALGVETTVSGVRVRISDSDGRVGLGEAVACTTVTGDTLESIEGAIRGPLRSAVVGGRLDELDRVLRSIEFAIVGNPSAKAAVDVAVHDLWARSLDRPLHALLGGARAEIVTDITISLDEPEAMASAAMRRITEGFGYLKVKLGGPPDVDLQRVRAVRAVSGSAVAIRVDANQAWSTKEAVAIIKKFEDENLGVELVEQPVRAADLEGLARVTASVATPIMADESCFSPEDALRLASGHVVDGLNIKLMKCGGLRPALAIVAIAEAAGIKCSVGCMMEGMVSATAAACLAAGRSSISSVDLDAPLWLTDIEGSGVATWNGERISFGDVAGLGTF
jgi:L-alanine-DL-glutamate epimerase-like enolase superfamily enzyme